MTDFVDELERLTQLRLQGALTDAEFARAKEKLLGDPGPFPMGPGPGSMSHGPGHMSGVSWPSIDSLLRQRKLIEAIKVYRQQTGASLREAKDAVEQRARML
jgi:hypothetical protein